MKMLETQVFIDQPLGQGGYAQVYRGILKLELDSQVQPIDVAVKRTLLYDGKNNKPYNSRVKTKLIELTMKEIHILEKANHPNIVKYYGYTECDEYIDIYLELCDGSMKEVLKLPMNVFDALEYFCQLLEATLFLRDLKIEFPNKQQELQQFVGIYHRDLNLRNTLLLRNKIKLTDFGLSRGAVINENEEITKQKGTPLYMSPQNFKKEQYDLEKNDVWAMGVLLYQLVYGYSEYNGMNAQKGLLTYADTVPEKVRQLLKNMLNTNEQNRYNFNDLQDHEFIQSFRKYKQQMRSNRITQIYETRMTLHQEIQTLVKQIPNAIEIKNDIMNYLLLSQLVWLDKMKSKHGMHNIHASMKGICKQIEMQYTMLQNQSIKIVGNTMNMDDHIILQAQLKQVVMDLRVRQKLEQFNDLPMKFARLVKWKQEKQRILLQDGSLFFSLEK